MKTISLGLLVLCVLFVVAVGCSKNKGAVIRVPELRVETRRPLGEGGPVLKRYFRGKEKIYDEHLVDLEKGRIARGYLVGGEIVMVESDEDGDGLFETITLFPGDLYKMEVFQRQSDGSVKPLDSEALQELKQKYCRAFQEFKKAFEKALKEVQKSN